MLGAGDIAVSETDLDVPTGADTSVEKNRQETNKQIIDRDE